MYKQILFCFLTAAFLCGCSKEEKLTSSTSAKLAFSTEKILFDTVFTSVGSVTQRLKVFNFNKNAVRISEIKLGGGITSSYQLNINGVAAASLSNVEVRGNDSLNIFVKININPTTGTLPFIVTDSITFLTNGNHQAVQLNAYGQNAHFLKDAVIAQNTVWDNSLPYVIYNSVKVNSGNTLTIPAKAKIYFHKDARMTIDGTLAVNGTLADSVVMSSDRLERLYQDEPGQWLGLHFTGTSKSNKINYAVIKNALIGIQADSLSGNADPKLILANTVVKNMQISGFAGYKTSLAGFNNLFFNCGQYLLYGVYGGDYNLKQNTFANYSSSVPRQTASLFFSDNLLGTPKTFLLNANLTNNIIWGSLLDELTFDKKGSAAIGLVLQNNLIRSKNTSFAANGNILNSDPLFISLRNDNYRIEGTSPAMNKGVNLATDSYYNQYLKTDKAGKTRLFPSELGCYEK